MLALSFATFTARAEEPAPPSPPSPAELARAVHRHLGRHAGPEGCSSPVTVGNELRYECTVIECPGGCDVVHVITILGYRAGRFRRVSRREEPRGETGECGCCM